MLVTFSPNMSCCFFYTIENNSLLSNLFVRRPIENLVSIVRSCLKNIGVGGVAGERVEQ